MKPEVLLQRHSINLPWTYSKLDQKQREIAERVRKGGAGALLLSEVAPVITLGRRTPSTDLLSTPDVYKNRGIQIYETDRGGLATYHGPGQWVVFVVDTLEHLTGDSRGVRKAVCGLLELAQNVARAFGVKTEVRDGAEQGVWTQKGKISAVGVHIEDRVLLHGLSFNVTQTEQSFWGLNPCGLKAPVAYLDQVVANEDESLFEQVSKVFALEAMKIFWKL